MDIDDSENPETDAVRRSLPGATLPRTYREAPRSDPHTRELEGIASHVRRHIVQRTPWIPGGLTVGVEHDHIIVRGRVPHMQAHETALELAHEAAGEVPVIDGLVVLR